MTRQPTEDEKKVFGHNCRIDPITDRPIEQGFGSLDRQLITGLRDRLARLAVEFHQIEAMGREVPQDLLARIADTKRQIAVFEKAPQE
ncbi:MAG: hypothetical protein JSR78_15225 [Proteobacteria bacterium]|nr:hypothetical protein [Pseudomonadota bacterium]